MSKELTQIDQLKNSIKQLEPQFKMVLPKHVTVEKFVRTVFTAIQQNKDLVDAERNSLFASCMKAASNGLSVDGKEAVLVAFKNKQGQKIVQYMPMVSGILKLIRQSGELSSITSQIVYEKDSFRYWIDSRGEHIEHEPNFFSDRGEPIGVYALASMKDGGIYIEVMTVNQIMDIKKSSRSADYGPWSGPFELEMWRKSVVRRLYKRLPSSTDLDSVIDADDALYVLDKKENVEKEVSAEVKQIDQPKAKRKSKLESIIESQDVSDPIEVKDEVPL